MVFSSRIEKNSIDNIPESRGIYRLYHGDKVIYKGETTNLRKRIHNHEFITSGWFSFDYQELDIKKH